MTAQFLFVFADHQFPPDPLDRNPFQMTVPTYVYTGHWVRVALPTWFNAISRLNSCWASWTCYFTSLSFTFHMSRVMMLTPLSRAELHIQSGTMCEVLSIFVGNRWDCGPWSLMEHFFSWCILRSPTCPVSLREGRWKVLDWMEHSPHHSQEKACPTLYQASFIKFLWNNLATSLHMTQWAAVGVSSFLGKAGRVAGRDKLWASERRLLYGQQPFRDLWSKRQRRRWAHQETQPGQTLKASEGEWLICLTFHARDKGKAGVLILLGVHKG